MMGKTAHPQSVQVRSHEKRHKALVRTCRWPCWKLQVLLNSRPKLRLDKSMTVPTCTLPTSTDSQSRGRAVRACNQPRVPACSSAFLKLSTISKPAGVPLQLFEKTHLPASGSGRHMALELLACRVSNFTLKLKKLEERRMSFLEIFCICGCG
jgi:hypothetical protein